MKKIMVLVCLILMIFGAGSVFGLETPEVCGAATCDPCQRCVSSGGTLFCSNDADPGVPVQCSWGTGPEDICEPVGNCNFGGVAATCSVQPGDPCLTIICDTENNIICTDVNGQGAGTCHCPPPPSAPEFSTYGIIAAVVVIAGIAVVLVYKKKKQVPEVKE